MPGVQSFCSIVQNSRNSRRSDTRYARGMHECMLDNVCTNLRQLRGQFVRSWKSQRRRSVCLLRYAVIYAHLIGRNLSRPHCINFRAGFMHPCGKPRVTRVYCRHWALIARFLLYYFARSAIGSIRHGRQEKNRKKIGGPDESDVMRRFVSSTSNKNVRALVIDLRIVLRYYSWNVC